MLVEPLKNDPLASVVAELEAKQNGGSARTENGADQTTLAFDAKWFEGVELGIGSWLLKGVLPKAGLGAIWGPPGSGKSTVAVQVALSIAQGVDVLGARCSRGGVLYLAAEDPDGIRTRIAAWRKEHGADPLPFLFVPAPVGFDANQEDHVTAVVNLAREHAAGFEARGAPLALIIADTFARSLPGLDENSAPEMSAAIAKLADLGRELKALVLIVHHAGKDASRGERGHSSLRAALDVSLEVQRADDRRILKLSKSKNAVDGTEWAFELKPVALGVDEDGDELNSCVAVFLEQTEAAPKSRAGVDIPAFKKLPAKDEIVGRTIAEAISKAGGPVREADVIKAGLAILRDASNKTPDKAAKMAWARGIANLIAAHLLARDDGVLTMSQMALLRFGYAETKGTQEGNAPAPDKPARKKESRLAVHQKLFTQAWRAHGERREGAPHLSREGFRKHLEAIGFKPRAAKNAADPMHAGKPINVLLEAGLITVAAGGWIIANKEWASQCTR